MIAFRDGESPIDWSDADVETKIAEMTEDVRKAVTTAKKAEEQRKKAKESRKRKKSKKEESDDDE